MKMIKPINFNALKEKKRSRTYHDFVDLLAIERTLENLKNVIPESDILEKYLCATRNMKGKALRKFGRRSPISFNEGVSQ
ncbi:MAG: hypothetical protein ACYDAO_05300 [Thermoplasmataceae archaeon]